LGPLLMPTLFNLKLLKWAR